jgi:hypothetical protein
MSQWSAWLNVIECSNHRYGIGALCVATRNCRSISFSLVVPFLLWCLGCRLRVVDEVRCPFVGGDVDVLFPEESF